MTPEDVRRSDDEVRGLVLALMERLAAKTQNYGAVRACEPFLSQKDMEEVVKRGAALADQLTKARNGMSPSGLLLPPGATG